MAKKSWPWRSRWRRKRSDKLTTKYGIRLIEGFRCDFRDPFGNRIQVVDLHDESLVRLLPDQELQKVGIKF